MLSNDVEIGTRILHQLGGARFTLFTGCSNYAATDNGLQFKLGRNSRKMTHCVIVLTAKDEYRIEYKHIKRSDMRTLKTVLVQEGITDETLQASFTEATGIFTHL